LIEALKKHVIHSVSGDEKDWEIVEFPVDLIDDPAEHNTQAPKLKVYTKELDKGSIFPPIVIDENNAVLDGTHRLHAYRNLFRELIPVLRPVGKGTGRVVNDEYFDPLIRKLKEEGRDADFFIPSDESPNCLVCGRALEFVDYGVNKTHHAFPEGLPRGPFYFCARDKIIVSKKSFIGWAAVKK